LDTKNKEGTISKKEFQEIINNLDIGYFKGELNGKLLIHNSAINKIIGIDPSLDLTGSYSSQFSSDPEVLERYHNDLKKNRHVKDFIMKIRNPKGQFLYIQFNSHLIEDGDQLLVEGTVIDVTEKYLLERNLMDTEKKFNLIANNTNDLIAILNQDFEYIFINENAYYSVLGYKKEEVLGKRPREFNHPDDLKRVSNAIKQGLLEGIVQEEFRIKHKDGHYIWVETKGKYLMEDNKLKGVIMISRDITNRKNSEKKIQESERKYRSLFESSTDGIYSADMEGNFIEFNKAFLKMLGYSKEQLLNLNLRQITPSKWYEIEDNMLFTHLAVGESKIYEKEYVQKNGTILCLLYTSPSPRD